MKNQYIIAVLLSFTLISGTQAKPPFGGGQQPGAPDQNVVTGLIRPAIMERSLNNSAALLDLYRDSQQLCGHQHTLINRVETAQTTLQTAAYALTALSAMQVTLTSLSTSVETLYTAALAAEAIPQSREKAKPIRESLEKTRTSLGNASRRMAAITAKTEPLRLKLQTAANRTGNIKTALTAINVIPCNTLPPLQVAVSCVRQMPYEKQACAFGKLDEAAGKYDPVVEDYDKVVSMLLVNPADLIPAVDFINPFSADLRAIDDLRAELNALTGRLNQLANQLSGLTAVLNQRFGFSFPYPNPSITNPLRISYQDVTVSGRIIMEGVGAIEDAIERYLSSALWEVLKRLGVDKYVHQLQDQFNSAMNWALSQVNFNMDISLPSMAALDAFDLDEVALESALDGLHIPELDLNFPGMKFPGLSAEISQPNLSLNLRFFNPSGLAIDAPGVCSGVDFGCK